MTPSTSLEELEHVASDVIRVGLIWKYRERAYIKPVVGKLALQPHPLTKRGKVQPLAMGQMQKQETASVVSYGHPGPLRPMEVGRFAFANPAADAMFHAWILEIYKARPSTTVPLGSWRKHVGIVTCGNRHDKVGNERRLFKHDPFDPPRVSLQLLDSLSGIPG